MKIEDELDGRFRNDYHKGLINIIYTANSLNFEFQKYLKTKGLSTQQYNVLKILRGFGSQPRSIEFLRQRMLDKKSDISRIIDKLFEKKLVDRVEAKNDRRQKDVSITTAGLQILSKMDQCEQKGDLLLKNLNPAEIFELNRLLDKIRD